MNRTLRVRSPRRGTCPVALCLLCVLAACSPKINLDPYHVLGVVAAEEVAKLVGGQGEVLVMARDTGPAKNPSVEAELEAIEQTFKKHPGIHHLTEKILATPMLMMATGGGVPPDQLFRALESHPKVRAVVLLCALPPLAEPEVEALKRRGTKILVVSSFRPDYQRLFEQDVLHVVIVPRPESPPPDARKPRTVRERFDQDYLLVTAADLDRP
ncbi:MAG: hypothetical protein FJ387_17840 [Verrucomicrobia bacterium]|nr:hypothetical protein [Verrucomicrobiota bacterium]